MNRRELAALTLQSESAAERLHARVDREAGPTVTISRDEAREYAERMRMLAGVARDHHDAICKGEVTT